MKTQQMQKQLKANKVGSKGASSMAKQLSNSSLMQQKTKESQGLFGGVVQAKMNFDGGTSYLDNKRNAIELSSYNKVQDKARKYYDVAELSFIEANPGGGAAANFTPDSNIFMDGTIRVKPLSAEDKEAQSSYEYNERLIEVSHETHHAIDHMEDLNLSTASYEQKVISEFRTFAVQSAVAFEMVQAGQKVPAKYKTFMKSFDPNDKDSLLEATNNGFARGHVMFNTIQTYLTKYSKQEHSAQMTEAFIAQHTGELQRAIAIYDSLKDNTEGEHDTYITKESEEHESLVSDDGEVAISEIVTTTKDVRKPVAE